MRICYLANANSIHTQRWVKYFASHGHEVHLISQMPFGGNNIENIKLYVLRRFNPRIPIISLLVNLLFNVIQVKRWVREIKPDILHAHYITSYGFWGALSGFHPLVLSAWGSDVLIDPKRSLLSRVLIKYTLKRADFFIAWSSAIKVALLNFGAQESRTSVIFLGIDTHQFNSARREERLRQWLGASKSPIVISTRTLSSLYSVDTLIRAIPPVVEELPETKFVIIGDGDQKDYLVKLATDKGITNATRFLGRVPHDELPKYLASSDIYVSTSLSDGTSQSLLEAMACELAPVVTDIPANQNWVTEGNNGCLFPIKDYKILAEKIIFLLRDKGARHNFGTIGRNLVVEHGQYEQKMEEVEKIYQNLANKVNSY